MPTTVLPHCLYPSRSCTTRSVLLVKSLLNILPESCLALTVRSAFGGCDDVVSLSARSPPLGCLPFEIRHRLHQIPSICPATYSLNLVRGPFQRPWAKRISSRDDFSVRRGYECAVFFYIAIFSSQKSKCIFSNISFFRCGQKESSQQVSLRIAVSYNLVFALDCASRASFFCIGPSFSCVSISPPKEKDSTAYVHDILCFQSYAFGSFRQCHHVFHVLSLPECPIGHLPVLATCCGRVDEATACSLPPCRAEEFRWLRGTFLESCNILFVVKVSVHEDNAIVVGLCSILSLFETKVGSRFPPCQPRAVCTNPTPFVVFMFLSRSDTYLATWSYRRGFTFYLSLGVLLFPPGFCLVPCHTKIFGEKPRAHSETFVFPFPNISIFKFITTLVVSRLHYHLPIAPMGQSRNVYSKI